VGPDEKKDSDGDKAEITTRMVIVIDRPGGGNYHFHNL